MISHVHSERIVDCPYSVAATHAAQRLSEFEPPSSDTVRVPFAALGLPFPGMLEHPVELSFSRHIAVDYPARREKEEIHFRWCAETRWLPDFSGTLRFCIASHRETLLLLEGTYRPPFGAAGSIFDQLIGHRIAAATARDLLARLGDALESDERAFRAAHPSTS